MYICLLSGETITETILELCAHYLPTDTWHTAEQASDPDYKYQGCGFGLFALLSDGLWYPVEEAKN
tara:strand:- start:149 stop:346 length:198 start_codon:yes stop_codon:yes gene_type:complete